jgi:hypothetical protein
MTGVVVRAHPPASGRGRKTGWNEGSPRLRRGGFLAARGPARSFRAPLHSRAVADGGLAGEEEVYFPLEHYAVGGIGSLPREPPWSPFSAFSYQVGIVKTRGAVVIRETAHREDQSGTSHHVGVVLRLIRGGRPNPRGARSRNGFPFPWDMFRPRERVHPSRLPDPAGSGHSNQVRRHRSPVTQSHSLPPRGRGQATCRFIGET